jgi:hypothetical protein
MPLAKTIIKRDFPTVTKIVDAKETIEITVEPQDSVRGRRKDPAGCALVKACIRQKIADAAIIGIGYSYLIKGNTATRYKTSTAVGREITSFDRHNDFAAGRNYKLSRVSPKARLGYKDPGDGGPHTTTREHIPVVYHKTANVRVMRNAKTF